MTTLSAFLDWLTSGDSVLGNVASAIAILTVVLGYKPVTRWGTAIRRGVAGQQFHLPGEAPLTPVSYPNCQIKMLGLAGYGSGDWRIEWTEVGGREQNAIATIRSPRLRWHLYWRRDASEFQIAGEVSYLRAENGDARFVEITALNFICHNWFSEYVVGGEWRRVLRRFVLDWSAPNRKARRPVNSQKDAA